MCWLTLPYATLRYKPHRLWLVAVKLALFTVATGTAVAAPAPSGPQPEPAGRTVSVALQRFMPAPGPIRLASASARHDLVIPISTRLVVTDASLKLRFTNSIALLKERSQLNILFNDAVVAQLPLRADKAQVEAEIALPRELLRTGYNRLAFEVAQHYTLECEDPLAPELWTQIDTKHSRLVLRGTRNRTAPLLSQLDQLIDPGVGGPRNFAVLIPEGSTEPHHNAAALVAQAIGQRLQFRSARFTHRLADNAAASAPTGWFAGAWHSELGSDAILIGTRAELSPLLAPKIAEQIADAFLGIYPQAADPAHFILVVSGTTAEQVGRAARALNILNFPYADSATTLVKSVTGSAQPRYDRKRYLRLGRRYTLRDLGIPTRTAHGRGILASSGEFTLDFNLPADFYVADATKVTMKLDYAYGAGMRSDSVMNVYLNGLFQRAVNLGESGGGIFRDYELQFRMRDFHPGRNNLYFEPAMVPQVTGECISINDRNLKFTLFDTTEIEFPEAAHYAAQPDLMRFAESLYPYANGGKAAPLTLVLPAADNESLAAAWTLLARMAQIADAPMITLRVTPTMPADAQQLLVLAPYDQVPAELLKHAPVRLGEWNRYPYRVQQASVSDVVDDAADAETPRLPRDAYTHLEQDARPVAHGLVTAFESPYAPKHTVTLFTAADAPSLSRAIRTLVKPEVWTQLRGDVALWSDSKTPVATQAVSTPYMLGEPPARDWLRYHLSARPWLFILGALLLISAFAWVTAHLLKRSFAKRHGASARIED